MVTSGPYPLSIPGEIQLHRSELRGNKIQYSIHITRMKKPRVAVSYLLLLSVSVGAFAPHTTLARTHRYCRRSQLSATVVREDLLDAVLQQEQKDSHTIQGLVQTLLSNGGEPLTYTPSGSLFGPFFCTIATFTPGEDRTDPLWERISLKANNLKGQQYSYIDNNDQTKGSVINYSEVWGPAVHLRATGTFAESTDSPQTEEHPKERHWWSVMSPTKEASTSKRSRTCPDDFTVTVTGASIHVLGVVFQLPIEGTSTLRVLYADPELRIFVSPRDTDSSIGDWKNTGEWENAGLVVVQVRSDLVTGDDAPMDLRKQ
jgi:hypothetical protein